MCETTRNLIIGVSSGVITAFMLSLVKSLFTNSFLPWYRQVMYKGVDLNGKWYQYDSGQKTLLEISQTCESIKGKATIHTIDQIDGAKLDDIRTFDVSGEVSQQFVTLIFHHTDRSRLGIATYLLQIYGDGTTLNGQAGWYAPLLSQINSGPSIFYRNEKQALENKTDYDDLQKTQ